MDIYMQILDLIGDSANANFPGSKGWFVVESYSWGVAVVDSTWVAGKSSTQTFNVQRQSTPHSSALMLIAAKAAALKSVVIALTQTLSGKEVIITQYTLAPVFPVGYSVSADNGSPQTEAISFLPEMVTYEQFPPTSGAAPITHTWNFKTNTGS